jgi:hypothetical protein
LQRAYFPRNLEYAGEIKHSPNDEHIHQYENAKTAEKLLIERKILKSSCYLPSGKKKEHRVHETKKRILIFIYRISMMITR